MGIFIISDHIFFLINLHFGKEIGPFEILVNYNLASAFEITAYLCSLECTYII